MSYKSGSFILDNGTTEMLGNEIVSMIKDKIIEQNDFLANNRIEGHIYEVDENDRVVFRDGEYKNIEN